MYIYAFFFDVEINEELKVQPRMRRIAREAVVMRQGKLKWWMWSSALISHIFTKSSFLRHGNAAHHLSFFFWLTVKLGKGSGGQIAHADRKHDTFCHKLLKVYHIMCLATHQESERRKKFKHYRCKIWFLFHCSYVCMRVSVRVRAFMWEFVCMCWLFFFYTCVTVCVWATPVIGFFVSRGYEESPYEPYLLYEE